LPTSKSQSRSGPKKYPPQAVCYVLTYDDTTAVGTSHLKFELSPSLTRFFGRDINAQSCSDLLGIQIDCFRICLRTSAYFAFLSAIMQSVLRSARLPTRTLRATPFASSTSRRYATESYGSSQSGQEEVNKDTPNPTADQEHPGPKAPADKGTAQSGQSQGSGSRSRKPAIHQPGPPPENKDAEVEAHNKDMEKRSDRTANQLYEEDNKVDKNFWQGTWASPPPALTLS
jgi:hypothetical protein